MSTYDEIEIKKEIGKIVAEKRKAAKLSQEFLAEKLKIKVRTLSKIENGHTFLSAKTLCKLCDYFNLPPKFFFDFDNTANIDERKLNEIIDKLRLGGNHKIDFYYELINLVDNKYNE